MIFFFCFILLLLLLLLFFRSDDPIQVLSTPIFTRFEGQKLCTSQCKLPYTPPPPSGRDIARHLRGIFRYLTSERAYYSWNVTNHMRPTISGPDLPYQAPTYDIRPRHTISGPHTKQRIPVMFKAFFSRYSN